MKEYKHETIITSKEAWKFLWNLERQQAGFKPLSDEQLNRLWLRISDFRNGGANPASHPICDNEIRLDRDSFNAKFEYVKAVLNQNGFSYRQDGFVVVGIYV